MKRKIAAILLFVAAGLCAATAIFYVGKYHKGKQEYDEIKKEVISMPENDNDNEKDKDSEEDRIIVDWKGMLAQNPDYVGWIEMMNGASYPVVQAKDNDYYLHRGFHKEYNINGCIFMSCYSDREWKGKNTIVYGHNMLNGTMFGSHKKYNNEEYARENPYFYIHVEGGYYVYRIYTYLLVEDATYPYIADVLTDDDMAEYIQKTKPMSVYWIEEAAPSPKDRIVTLSACIGQAGGTHRQLIQGKYEKFVRYPADNKEGGGGN